MVARHSFSSSCPAGSASSELGGVLESRRTQRGVLGRGASLAEAEEGGESRLAGDEVRVVPLGSCGRLRPDSSEMSRAMAFAPWLRVGGREFRLVDL